MLLTVSGVGPKAAISILSAVTPETLALAVMSGDEKALTSAQGVGKKIAQRVILELKDKIAKQTDMPQFIPPAAVSAHADSSALNDAIAALSVLGYGTVEINAALKAVNVSELNAEEIIKAVLRQMVK